ncbi:MAG: extracellular solute-binding protein [Phycisphaerae bacterium]|nr:extracellular solute-binding protein [Phycisphaerae bacterium]
MRSRNLLIQFAKAARLIVGAVAAAILLFSFLWVFAYRPIRDGVQRADEIVISLIHWGEDDEDRIVADLVKDFLEQPGNEKIRVRRTNLGQAAAVNTKLHAMFAAGEPPDVFYLGYEKVADLASKDLLADIDRLIADDVAAGRETVDLSGYFLNVVDCFRFDRETQRMGNRRGRLVALPKDFTPAGFYYNKTLLARAGVAEPPIAGWTWEEFITASREVARLPGCYGADFVTWETMVRLFAWNHGVDFLSNDFSEHYLNDPKLHAVLATLQGWFHNEKRTLFSAKTQLETGMEPFLAGNVGFAGPLGRWKVPTYRLIRSFEWDYAPLPHSQGLPARNGIFTAAWGIANSSPRKAEAWRFVKHMNSRPAQERMCRAGLALSVIKEVSNGPDFIDEGRPPRNYRAYLDAAEYAEPINWPADPAYLHQLRVRLENIFKQNADIPAKLAEVDREWRQIERKHANEVHYTRVNWAGVIGWIVGPIGAFAVGGTVYWWVRRPRGQAMREELAGNIMVSPWVIGLMAFTAFPIVMSFLLSFMRWSGMASLDTAKWVGFDNFVSMWEFDPTFVRALYVTTVYALLAVPSGQIAALLAAMLMNHEWKGIGAFRAIWYLPSVLAGVGMAVMWKWVFHHEHGLMNDVLSKILPASVAPPAWFEKDADRWGVPAFAIVNLWSIGGTMMIYLAGLKGISKELYEAAAIDGATGWRRFLHVTLPMLSPVIFFNVIIAIIASFQVFTQAFIMTGGGPGNATRFYVIQLYNQAFDLHDMGYASAMAWLLLLIVLGLTIVVMRGSRRFVYYEALKG